MNKHRLSTLDVWNIKPGDILKSYKSKGMKKYEFDAKTYEAFNEDTPMINIKDFRVERSFNTNVGGKHQRFVRLQNGEEGSNIFQDINIIFSMDTKIKCWCFEVSNELNKSNNVTDEIHKKKMLLCKYIKEKEASKK